VPYILGSVCSTDIVSEVGGIEKVMKARELRYEPTWAISWTLVLARLGGMSTFIGRYLLYGLLVRHGD
jgi:hypothetical protein